MSTAMIQETENVASFIVASSRGEIIMLLDSLSPGCTDIASPNSQATQGQRAVQDFPEQRELPFLGLRLSSGKIS